MSNVDNIVEMQIAALDGGLTKVTLSGRLDTPGVDRIEARFAAAAVSHGKSAIVDMSRITFVGSTGIRMFIAAARSMSHRRVKLALYGAQPLVKEVFDNVSLGEIVPVVESESEAITSVAP